MYSENHRSRTPSSLRRKLPQTPDEQHYSMPNSPKGFDKNVPAGFYSSRLHRKVYEIRSSEYRLVLI
uniref:Uncharacterized protein n=1 Tax=Panagrolaimus sp. JU765 TaxID=591449 RepID=A0AC34RKQ0_9BILA